MHYDINNPFAKILKKDITSKDFYEDDFIKVFHDISPEAPVHLLLIPKGPYKDFYHFISSAGDAEQAGFFKGIQKVIELLKLTEGGYRLVTNAGPTAGQTVFHFHLHLLAGKKLEKLC